MIQVYNNISYTVFYRLIAVATIFQVEIGAATNQDLYIKIAHMV